MDDFEDIDSRLEEANCYKTLLKQKFFTEPSSVEQIVDDKIKAFIKLELRILLGLEQRKAEFNSEFSEIQTGVLKAWANKLIEKEQTNSTSLGQLQIITSNAGPSPVPEIFVEKEIQLPDGTTKVIKINQREQTRDVPAVRMTAQELADQQSMLNQMQVSSYAPQSGVLGIAVTNALMGAINEE